MKTEITLTKMAKQGLFALVLFLTTGFASIAQPLYTQDSSSPNFCDGWAYLDSMNLSNSSSPVWTDLSTNQIMNTAGPYSTFMLCPGDYSVSFTDNNGNNITLIFTIGVQGNPNPCQGFSATMTTTNTDLNACTGTATITVSGGTAPYSYSWGNSGAAMINSQQNLCAGFYFADVIDANGCTAFVWDTVHVNNTGGGGSNPSDTIIIIINNTFPPNSVTDSLPTVTILDCNLDFDSIGSAYITNVQATNLGALVTWTIYDFFGNVIATYDITYNNVNPNGAVYEATLILMCGRSINTVQITDQFEYITGSSSISEFFDLEINFVNPMTDVLKINFNREFEGQLILHDMKGATIFSTNVSAAHFEYNVSALNHGIYILHIHAQNGTSSIKLMK